MKDTIKKKKKIFILVMSSIILFSIFLVTIFGLVDYLRTTNGKKPIFIYRIVKNISYDVEIAELGETVDNDDKINSGLGNDVSVFKDTIMKAKSGYTYYGLGYNVSICDIETKNYKFNLGNNKPKSCYSTLSCTKELSNSDEEIQKYSFFDGKLYLIEKILKNKKETKDQEEFIKLNSIKGCAITSLKEEDNQYITTQICNIFNMSNEDIKNLYLKDKKELVKTKEEVLDEALANNYICK